MRIQLTNFAWIAALLLAAGGSARADVIDFQALGSASTPFWFDGNLDSPLAITTATNNVVTLTGGELINHQFLGTDQTIVYATENLPGAGPPVNYPGVYSNPLKVSFKTAVNGFSVQITNELNAQYVITDNLGNSVTQDIPLDTTETLTLADSGIQWVTITSLPTAGTWEYAIDNLSFNGPSIPEPSSATLLLMALGGIAGVALRRRSNC